MKRFITIGTSALVLAVGGTMLATPARAATTSLSCSEDQLQEALEIALNACGGRFSEAYVTCPSSGVMTMYVDTYC